MVDLELWGRGISGANQCIMKAESCMYLAFACTESSRAHVLTIGSNSMSKRIL